MPSTIALSRTYVQDPLKMGNTIAQNKRLAEQLKGKVDHLRFIVWEDSAFPDADCGLLYSALLDAFQGDKFVSVRRAGGDIFVDVLNAQLDEVYREGFDWLLVISATSGHFITATLAECVFEAMQNGVDAIAIVPPDVPVTGKGAITNQCAYWLVPFLIRKGGFDKIDRRPVDFRYDRDYQGVGELANLFDSEQKQPLAVIYPDVDDGDDRTHAQDPKQLEKLRHKERRIDVVLKMLGKTRADLASLIRDGYPIDLRAKTSA